VLGVGFLCHKVFAHAVLSEFLPTFHLLTLLVHSQTIYRSDSSFFL